MRKALRHAALCAALLASSAVAQTQTASPHAETEAVAPALVAPPLKPGFLRLEAGQPVLIEIAEPISSKTAKIDDWFTIRLAAPIMAGDTLVVPAGTLGKGQVVHAAKARALGKPGELIVAARYLACGGTHVDLRGFHLDGAGRDRANVVIMGGAAAALAGAPLMLMAGAEMVIPAGTRGPAKIRALTDVPATFAAGCTADAAAKPIAES